MSRFTICLILALAAVCAAALAVGCDDDDDDCPDCADDDDDDDTADDDTGDDDDDDTDLPAPTLGATVAVVPSEGLPAEVVLQNANNNLDAAWHDGRVFLAFRTAPFHFASSQATLYVVSSADQITWRFEGTFTMDKDLREPRLLSWDGRLFLYFAVLGTNPFNFEPGGMMVAEYLGVDDWTEPEYFYGEGFIPWRTRVIDGVPYMIAYVGGEGIYSADPEPIEVHWLTTADGFEWVPVVPGQAAVLIGGVSETDFAFLDDGGLVAVGRNEMGDEGGFGSRICRAAAGDLGNWQCVSDPRKYDSPFVFRHGDQVYLIGRRNLNGTGYYDLGFNDLPQDVQRLLYEADYWIQPKRCSLWRVDPELLAVEFVLDFPSRGDTCFPAAIATDAQRYQVYNYTSPVDGPDTVWVLGQLGPTHILRTELAFAE